MIQTVTLMGFSVSCIGLLREMGLSGSASARACVCVCVYKKCAYVCGLREKSGHAVLEDSPGLPNSQQITNTHSRRGLK